ncbi:MAG: glycoside hydrolase family 38 C-terminal domain-containing protein [bacterium]
MTSRTQNKRSIAVGVTFPRRMFAHGFPALLAAAALAVSVQVSVAVNVDIEVPAAEIKPAASGAYSPSQCVANLVNGAGLNNDLHDNNGSAVTMWHTAEKPSASAVAGIQAPAWVRFDFDRPEAFNRILIWNHNQQNLTDRGFRKTTILGTADGTTWKTLAETELPQASGGAAAPTVVALTLKQPLKAVVIAALSNWGGNVYGLSEVRFVSTLTDVAAADLPFPQELECVPQPFCRYRADGQAGREVQVTFRGAKLYASAELEVAFGGQAETTKIPSAPKGVPSASVLLPPGVGAAKDADGIITLKSGGKSLRQPIRVPARRQMTVYVVPHSHTDIGYTEIQTAIEKKQVNNLLEGIAAARKTADYPEGARFKWSVEVLWAADLYQRRMNDRQRADFLDAVKKGQVSLCGMYLNELTGLCRPEELIRLFRYSTKLSEQCGVKIDSAMISDVPGYTWGTVPAMAQAGIKYFSAAPNFFDRIGTILREWENKPFYWVGPDGTSKVLVWIPFWGYAMSMRYGGMSATLVKDLMEGLEGRKYPYDIAYVRWAGYGDNAVPDPSICEFIKEWNGKYAWPKFVIASASEAFSALEKRYGKELPAVRGDWTPYWEDGAGSSALETAMNRGSSDRLVQAEAIYAMARPGSYPSPAFEDAWNQVLLYSEHTWGAHCSVNGPERQETKEQWEIKQGYALAADRQSRALLDQALKAGYAGAGGPPSGIDVVNTLSYPRTELALLSKEQSTAGDRVADETGRPVPSQRLTTGELAFVARGVPPFAAKRYTVSAGTAFQDERSPVTPQGVVLENGRVRVRLDEQTGGIVELRAKEIDANLADTASGEAINDYLYLPGDKLADLKRSGQPRISIKEKGPLVASLVVESEAPGCNKLIREIRMVAGFDHVELINNVDKKRLEAKSYMATEGKESVNFAFPFNVPGGEMLVDLPLGAMRPEKDQMPSACKNWVTVGRWINVANKDYGVTWVTLDAPLVELGGITANLLNSQTNPDVWRKTIEPTQKLYSWAMNNHWGTNYRAYQEGPTVFRFILRPFRQATPDEATRFATGFSQPLLAVAATGKQARETPALSVEPAGVLVTGFKPSDDGKAVIVRLFGASGKECAAKLTWAEPRPKNVFFSDTSEKPLAKAGSPVKIPAWGLVTLRVE